MTVIDTTTSSVVGAPANAHHAIDRGLELEFLAGHVGEVVEQDVGDDHQELRDLDVLTPLLGHDVQVRHAEAMPRPAIEKPALRVADPLVALDRIDDERREGSGAQLLEAVGEHGQLVGVLVEPVVLALAQPVRDDPRDRTVQARRELRLAARQLLDVRSTHPGERQRPDGDDARHRRVAARERHLADEAARPDTRDLAPAHIDAGHALLNQKQRAGMLATDDDRLTVVDPDVPRDARQSGLVVDRQLVERP